APPCVSACASSSVSPKTSGTPSAPSPTAPGPSSPPAAATGASWSTTPAPSPSPSSATTASPRAPGSRPLGLPAPGAPGPPGPRPTRAPAHPGPGLTSLADAYQPFRHAGAPRPLGSQDRH